MNRNDMQLELNAWLRRGKNDSVSREEIHLIGMGKALKMHFPGLKNQKRLRGTNLGKKL